MIPIDILKALAPHAARRGMHLNKLARLIFETVVDARIIDADLVDVHSKPRDRK